MSFPRIEGSTEGAELGLKRLGLECLTLVSLCPNCGKEHQEKLNDQPCYPKLGEAAPVYFCCDDCGVDWEEDVVVDLTVKAVGSK